MPLLIVQRGHVPRTTGATGTEGEQTMALSVAALMKAHIPTGWTLRIIDADVDDAAYSGGDVFVAIHGDGSKNRAVRGASVGYMTAEGAAIAARWKAAYDAAGWPGGWHKDNYTAALSGYYGVRRAVTIGHIRAAFILEVGTMTNQADRAWIDANHSTIAATIWRAVAGTVTEEADTVKVLIGAPGRVWRLTDGSTHRWRNSEDGINAALKAGFTLDGPAFDLAGDIPVHSLVSPSGSPLLTIDAAEIAALKAARWTDEGVIGGAGDDGPPVYRLARGERHIHTTDAAERDRLIGAGWTDEGIGFYAGTPSLSDANERIAALEAKLDKVAAFARDLIAAVA